MNKANKGLSVLLLGIMIFIVSIGISFLNEVTLYLEANEDLNNSQFYYYHNVNNVSSHQIDLITLNNTNLLLDENNITIVDYPDVMENTSDYFSNYILDNNNLTKFQGLDLHLEDLNTLSYYTINSHSQIKNNATYQILLWNITKLCSWSIYGTELIDENYEFNLGNVEELAGIGILNNMVSVYDWESTSFKEFAILQENTYYIFEITILNDTSITYTLYNQTSLVNSSEWSFSDDNFDEDFYIGYKISCSNENEGTYNFGFLSFDCSNNADYYNFSVFDFSFKESNHYYLDEEVYYYHNANSIQDFDMELISNNNTNLNYFEVRIDGNKYYNFTSVNDLDINLNFNITIVSFSDYDFELLFNISIDYYFESITKDYVNVAIVPVFTGIIIVGSLLMFLMKKEDMI